MSSFSFWVYSFNESLVIHLIVNIQVVEEDADDYDDDYDYDVRM